MVRFETFAKQLDRGDARPRPPPMPLKIATICGMAVILTTRAQYQPASPPTITPMAISAKFERPGLDEA